MSNDVGKSMEGEILFKFTISGTRWQPTCSGAADGGREVSFVVSMPLVSEGADGGREVVIGISMPLVSEAADGGREVAFGISMSSESSSTW